MSDDEKTALAPRPDKTPVPIGVAPVDLDQAWRWAQQAAQSELVPKDYRGKPHNILVAVQMGVEVGLPPMTALQSIAVINGRPGLFGDGLLALVMTSPKYAGHEEWFEVGDKAVDAPTPEELTFETTRAVCEFVRKGRPTPVRRTFSVGDALRAGLLKKDGPWQTYPARMLAWRALGFAARAAFPDVLKGLRTVEELRDIPADEVIDVPAPPVVKRRSDRQADEASS